jgi:hypothetical protein
MERTEGEFEGIFRVPTIVGGALAALIAIQLVASVARAQWGHVVGAAAALVAMGSVTWLRRNRSRPGWASFLIVGAARRS